MKKQEFKKWKNLVEKILDNCRQFRMLCNSPFDRGFIGELLVLNQLLKTYESELCSSDNNKIIYAGSSNKGWDFELSLGSKKIKIDAKATTTTVSKKDKTPKWVRQHAAKFCKIENKKNQVKIISLYNNNEQGIFYVYVDVTTWLDGHAPQFFTLSDKQAKSVFGEKYRHSYNGRRRISDDFWVEYNDVRNFIDQRLKKIEK